MRWKHPWHTCLPFASFMFLQRFQSTSSLIYNCTDTVKLANINTVKQHTVLSIITFYGLLRLIHYQYKLFHICCDMDPAWSAQLLCHRHLHVAYRLLQRWHYNLLGKNFLVRDNHSVHKVNIWCICICMVYMTAQFCSVYTKTVGRVFRTIWLAAQSRNILHYSLIHLQFLRASEAKLT